MKLRTEHIDMAAGIMLTWMILCHIAAHAGYEGIFPIVGNYLSFFMPWFFYKAGMFYREKSWHERVIGGAKKLLIPYLIYSLIGQLIYNICLIVEHNVTFHSLVYQPLRCLFVTECLPGNGALWFLVVLYLVNLIVPYIINKIHPIIIATIGVGVSFAFYLLDVSWFPCIFPNTAAGIAFYILGYYCRDKEDKGWMLGFAIAIYAACCIVGFPGIYFHHNTATNAMTYLLYYPASFAGIILLNNICRRLNPYVKYSLFRWVGQNSMNIYVTHWIVLELLRLIVLDIAKVYDSNLLFSIYIVIMIITIPISNWLINTIKIKHQ